MNKLHHIDNEARLYHIDCGTGFTSLGFDVCRKWTEAIAKWLGIMPPSPSLVGSPAYYAAYQEISEKGQQHNKRTGERCNALLTPQLVGMEGKIVEVIDHPEHLYGKEPVPRRFRVGKSTGWMPTHLEMEQRAEFGDCAQPKYQSVKVVKGFKVKVG